MKNGFITSLALFIVVFISVMYIKNINQSESEKIEKFPKS